MISSYACVYVPLFACIKEFNGPFCRYVQSASPGVFCVPSYVYFYSVVRQQTAFISTTSHAAHAHLHTTSTSPLMTSTATHTAPAESTSSSVTLTADWKRRPSLATAMPSAANGQSASQPGQAPTTTSPKATKTKLPFVAPPTYYGCGTYKHVPSLTLQLPKRKFLLRKTYKTCKVHQTDVAFYRTYWSASADESYRFKGALCSSCKSRCRPGRYRETEMCQVRIYHSKDVFVPTMLDSALC